MYSELFDTALHAALEGATVITENRRTSRQLMSACQQKLGAGSSAWETPDILPLDAWLQRTWDDCVLSGNSRLALLRPIQQHALWKNIIMASKTEGLMDLSGAVAGAQEAWALLQQYAIELSAASFQVTTETRAFFNWAQPYREQCSARSWCDFGCLPDHICGLLPKIRPLLRRNVVFYGFDDFTTQQHSLLNGLRNAGLDVRLLIPDGVGLMSAQATCVALPDAQSELRAAAQWARNLVQTNPQNRIGIVVANMAGLRPDVEHIFAEVLHPEGMLVENLTAPRAFDVSLGRALDSYPIVQVALLALQTALSVIPTADASMLIRSPYIAGGVAEASPRACFDLFLRGHAGPEVTVEQIKAAFTHPRNHANCVELRRRISRLSAVASGAVTPALPSRWTSIVGNILEVIGWPGTGDGGRPLSSTEYQATQAWSSLLSEFSTLDEFVPPLSANQMLSELKRLASNKLFKPENAGAPVQAMGVLEATGSVFDHLWVSGLSDDVWPPRGNACPFLPLALQRAANVPHCRPAQDMEFAQRVTQRLSASAPRVVFSWPRHEEDRPLRISPVLLELPAASLDKIVTDSAPKWADLQKGAAGNSYVDDRAPEPDCTAAQPGGTQVFKLQSNCPFRAFVELRLSAKRMDEPELGIRPVDRGKIVEKTLEIVWNQLHDHSTLHATTAEDLDALISGAVEQAMTEELAPASQEWEKRYRELQRSRFANILREWLECEKRREPFKVVEHQRPVTIAVNGVEVNGRIDRVDRLVGDGSLVILDYKSGNGSYSPGQWSGERPQEPQLPLYVLNQKDSVSAVAFAVLRTGECGFKGYGARKEILGFSRDNTGKYFAPGETFEQHVRAWEPVMDSIADGYRTGVATVDPKPERVCEYCHVTPLCRRADDRCEADDDGEKEQDDVE